MGIGVGRGVIVVVAVGVDVGVGGGVVVGVEVGVKVAVAVGVNVGVAVGVWLAVTVGVDVGVGLSHTVWTVSILQPSPALLASLPIRHRNTLVCPCGIPTHVVMKPPELPVQAWRPARGLPQQVLIVPL